MKNSKHSAVQDKTYSLGYGLWPFIGRTHFMYIAVLALCFQSCEWNNTKEPANVSVNIISEQTALIRFSTLNSKDTVLNTAKFTDRFVLNKDKFMSMHFDLKEPLVKSLQVLAPELKEDALLNQGNFQFSIRVDGETAYVENLSKGAGLAISKTTQLNHRIPLITPQPIDYWGWFMWLKFMKMAGGRDLLAQGTHTLGVEVRAYIQNDGLKVGPLLASGSITIDVADYPDLAITEDQTMVQDIPLGSGWEVSNDLFDKLQIEALNMRILQKRFEEVKGVVVIKDGKLLLEEYFNGATRDSLHDPRSVGKSIASTMMGIAIDDGFIQNEDLLLKDFYDLKLFDNYSEAKESISIQSLLTMTSGFQGDDGDFGSRGNEENMYPTDDWVKFVLDLPLYSNKEIGVDYTYFTGGAVLLGDMIHKSVPGGLVAYTDEKLFSPLGIRKYKWQYTPQNVGNTAGGIRLRAIDFAKYGQLYKNKGNWKGNQILGESWVEKSLSKRVVQPDQDGGYYGYLFWNKVYKVAGKEYEVAFCTGNGGNKIFIFKDIPFVVVITAAAYNLPYIHSDVDMMMTDYILPAVLND